MAIRDKSQKVGFVYTNIYQIYKKAKAAPDMAELKAAASLGVNMKSDSRIIRAEDLGNFKITKFEPRALTEPQVAEKVLEANDAKHGANPFDDLKSNLNRLQDLHSRLRFMLKELEDLVKKK